MNVHAASGWLSQDALRFCRCPSEGVGRAVRRLVLVLQSTALGLAALRGVAADSEIPSSGRGLRPSVRAQSTNDAFESISTSNVIFFFGGGSNDAMSRIIRERTGRTPYDTNQVASLAELRVKAIEQLKQENHDIQDDYLCLATIETSSGSCNLRFTKGMEWYYVEFDWRGRITETAGGKGVRGEGYWRHEYAGGSTNRPASGVRVTP